MEKQATSREYFHAGEEAIISAAAAIHPETPKKTQIYLESTNQAATKTQHEPQQAAGAATKHPTVQPEIHNECELEDNELQRQQAAL